MRRRLNLLAVSMTPLQRRFGPPVLLAAIAGLACGSLFVTWNDPIALSFPVDLRPGVTRSPSFTADYDHLYIAELVVDKGDEDEFIRCLLGAPREPAGATCKDPSPLAVSWTIYVDGRPGAPRGTSSDDSWQRILVREGEAAREIGGVNLERGRTYMIEVRSSRDASVLKPLNPRIQLAVHPLAFKDDIVTMGFVALGSLVAGFVALFWIAAALVQQFGERRRRARVG